MKKKFSITNALLMIAVLFAILFQSFDSYQHLEKRLSQKQCHHKYVGGNSEITHQHHNFDRCAVCEFTFSSFISPQTYFYPLQFAHRGIPYFFTATETPVSFSGSCYSLRGPPCFIV